MRWAVQAASTSAEAMTVDAGLEPIISRERFGPESAQMPRCMPDGNSSASTSLMRFPVPVSIPLVALTTMAFGGNARRTRRTFALNVREGTAMSTRSALSNASDGDADTDSASGKRTPGRNRAFSRAASRVAASASVRAQMLTSMPRRAIMTPSVVPQVVVPTMPTFGIFRPS